MLREVFVALGTFFDALLRMLGLSGLLAHAEPLGDKLRIFIKHGERSIILDLDPMWDVKKVKSIAAPKLGLQAEELKIIFAGRELQDDVRVEMCNLGQRSCLYAVKVQVRSRLQSEAESTTSSTRPGTPKIPTPIPNFLHHENYGDSAHVNEVPQAAANQSSDYFVYCGTCESVQEGKLRVRCDTCLSGAFCVLRDPESWDDVLIPKQVPGSCETPDCVGEYAQFYFKCSSHVTSGEDDTAPPLPLLKRNPDQVPCLACGDSSEPVLIFDCPSKHVTCVDCFKQYILVRLNERQFVEDTNVGYTVGCPVLCPNSLITNPHHFKILGRDQYDRYQRFGTEEYVLKSGGVLCPQPDCGMGILPVDVGCNKIACVHGCGYVFCRNCLEGWHLGDCDTNNSTAQVIPGTSAQGYSLNAERVAQASWDDKSRRAVRLTTKPCPNCRVPTEKSAGCHHMTCTKCQFDWCWLCQVKWGRDCQGNHWFG